MNSKKRLQRRVVASLLLYVAPALLGAHFGVSGMSLALTFGLWPGVSRVLRQPLDPSLNGLMMAILSAGSTSLVAGLVCLVTSVLGSWCVFLWCLVAVEVAQRRVPRRADDPARWLMAY